MKQVFNIHFNPDRVPNPVRIKTNNTNNSHWHYQFPPAFELPLAFQLPLAFELPLASANGQNSTPPTGRSTTIERRKDVVSAFGMKFGHWDLLADRINFFIQRFVDRPMEIVASEIRWLKPTAIHTGWLKPLAIYTPFTIPTPLER